MKSNKFISFKGKSEWCCSLSHTSRTTVVDQLLKDIENAFKENILESIYDILRLDERQARALTGCTSE
jgi:hypothetical protein